MKWMTSRKPSRKPRQRAVSSHSVPHESGTRGTGRSISLTGSNSACGRGSVMRPLRYSINVTLDGCVDHQVGIVDEELHRRAAEEIDRSDALLLGLSLIHISEPTRLLSIS